MSSAVSGTRRFTILRRIGSGGMGIVYEAHDREKNCSVALKTLREAGAQNIYRFKNEFRALADLEHENLVRLGELFCEDEQWFFTMELVRGVDFLAYVRPGSEARAVSSSDAQTLHADDPVDFAPTVLDPPTDGTAVDEARLRSGLAQLAKGLAALHRAAKIHRDIKPSNVLVTSEGRLVLLDFGLVTDEDERTGDRRAVGTLGYMAPEQASGKPVGPTADWYGVGVVLYEALTGRLPFSGTAAEVLVGKLRGDPPAPQTIAPSVPADLAELCLALLRPDPGSRPSPARVLERLGVRTRSEPGLLAARALPAGASFVGRASELGALWRAFADTRAGGAVTVLLHGESGIGKTALVRRFLDELRAGEPNAIVLSGRCYERESLPYKAFDGVVDALSRALEGFDPAEVGALVPEGHASLVRVFPVLKRVPAFANAEAGPEERGDPLERRGRGFAAFRETLARLAARRPVVLFIDDFQWADVDSVALFVDVMLSRAAPRLLLLATVRGPADATAADVLGGATAQATALPARAAEIRDLAVRPLSPNETRELVLKLGAPAEDVPGVELVSREAAGHPLFVHELVRHRAAIGSGGSSPLRLDAAIWSRVERLDAPARAVLEVIAVASFPVSAAIVAEASGVGHAECTRCVGLLRVSHLIQASSIRGSDLLEPYHDRVREAVLANLDDDARRRHHARLALLFEGRPEEARVLVWHLLRAGEGAEAARHAERAGRMASDALAFDQAADLYAIALEYGRFGEIETRNLKMALARALVDAGRGPAAADVYLAAVPGADAAVRLGCQREAAQQLLMAGHVDRGLATLEAVLAEIGERLPRTPRRALLSLVWQRIKLRLRGFRWKERDPSEIAPAELARLDVYRAATLGLALVDSIRGADFQARALLLALRTGEVSRVGRALAYEAVFLATRGPRALADIGRLLDQARRIGVERADPYLVPMVIASEGMAMFCAGEYRKAAELFAETEAKYKENPFAGQRWEVNNLRLFRMMTLRHLGRLRELRPLFDDDVRDAVRRGDRYTETSLVRSMNVVWLAEDDPVGAHRQLDREIWVPPAGSFHLQHWYELMARGDLALYEGTSQHVHDRLARMFRGLERSLLLRVISTRVVCCWLRGRLALARAAREGGGARARAEALAMARRLEREGIAPATAWAGLLRAAVAAQENDPERAVTLLRDARETLEAAGLALYAAAARRREGQIVGGAEGVAQVAEADARMTSEGVVRPERLAEVYAPGFEPAAAR